MPRKLVAVGNHVEELPEHLLPDDEEYRRATQEKLGVSGGANRGGARNRPMPPLETALKGRSLAADFTSVTNGKIIASPLGYRLGSEEQQVALALNQLAQPVTATATWRFKIKAADGFPNPPYHQNGFFVFGDSTEDKDLVKCGIQFVRGTARIIQGLTTEQKGETANLGGNPQRTFDVTVSVDLTKQQVTLKTANKTLTAKLHRPLKSLTHTGYASWNAVTDFSPSP